VKQYLTLQYHLTNRKLTDAGILPILAYILLPVVFVGFSAYLFYKTEYAEPVYLLLALSVVGKHSDIRRNDFLRMCFGDTKQKQIRIAENLILALPFLGFLAWQQLFYSVLILIVLTMVLALVNFRTTLSFTIPTPFYKRPFEFAVGFRNTFYLFFAAYALTGIAVFVGNFNLGVFTMLLVFAVTLSFYVKPENDYYVWTYNNSPKWFLFDKIKTALLYSAFLALPIAMILGIFFSQNIPILLLFLLIGWSFLICMIVSKYAAYPDELNILQSVLLAMCIVFPPLLLVLIPYLFRKSEIRLSRLL
jgi:hypothetical protein